VSAQVCCSHCLLFAVQVRCKVSTLHACNHPLHVLCASSCLQTHVLHQAHLHNRAQSVTVTLGTCLLPVLAVALGRDLGGVWAWHETTSDPLQCCGYHAFAGD
jgi:hypothetical protein